MVPWKRLEIYDLYERHTVVNQLLRDYLPADTNHAPILDVGGRRDLLSAYTAHPVFAANPDGTGDLVSDGTMLPFADGAYEAVVTIDSLEHMPREVRPTFLNDCLRVARRLLLVAAPLGTPAHIQREKTLNEHFYSVNGVYHEYLNEHVQYGLPTPEDVSGYRRSLFNDDTKLFFAGDFEWQADAFERAISTTNGPRALALSYNLLQRLTASALFHPIDLRSEDFANANRFYLVVLKRESVGPLITRNTIVVPS